MITGGTLPSYPPFTVAADQPIIPGRVVEVDRGDHYELQTISEHSDRVTYNSDLPFVIVRARGNVAGRSVSGNGLAITEFRSALGQTSTHTTSLIPSTVTNQFDRVNPNSLAVATAQSYDPTGNTDPYDRDNNLLPGVDLTCIGRVRAIAITPREIAQAWHTRGNVGRSITFVDINGVEHVRTVVETSQQFGGDLVIQRLNEDLPDTVTPAKVFPSDVADYLSDATREFTRGFIAILANNISVGNFFFSGDLWDLGDSGEPSWQEAVGGNSGSSCFVVVNGQVVAQGGLWNTAEQCTAVHNYLPGIQAFCSHPLSIVDLSEFPRAN